MNNDPATLTFQDAVDIARGCSDYGGGYRYDPQQFQAYQAGIQTVVAALASAGKTGLSDAQIKVLHNIGQHQSTIEPAATVNSWVNGSCDRKYNMSVHIPLDAGTQLYTARQISSYVNVLRESLLRCARKAEALKRECGTDPDSPQAVRNSMYQDISTTAHVALGTIKGVSND